MIQEPESKAWIGCLSAAAVIIAAIIGLGVPFAERAADIYFPKPTPSTIVAPAQLTQEPLVAIQPSSPPTTKLSATEPPVVAQSVDRAPEGQAASIEDPTPIREHFQVSVGTGLFSSATFSDGLASYSEQWLWDNDHHNIQMIRQEEYPSGCDVARYDSELIWIAGTTGMQFTINDEVVGSYSAADFSHGYIVRWPVRMGDTLCAVGFKPIGFGIIIGPDIYYHYDSYCYRGHCK